LGKGPPLQHKKGVPFFSAKMEICYNYAMLSDQARRKFYGLAVWQRLRKEQKQRQPLCELCWENFRKQTVATIADHKDATWGEGVCSEAEAFEKFITAPLQSLCYKCHRDKTTDDLVEIKRKKMLEVKEYA